VMKVVVGSINFPVTVPMPFQQSPLHSAAIGCSGSWLPSRTRSRGGRASCQPGMQVRGRGLLSHFRRHAHLRRFKVDQSGHASVTAVSRRQQSLA
jgi:hypothetical protein